MTEGGSPKKFFGEQYEEILPSLRVPITLDKTSRETLLAEREKFERVAKAASITMIGKETFKEIHTLGEEDVQNLETIAQKFGTREAANFCSPLRLEPFREGDPRRELVLALMVHPNELARSLAHNPRSLRVIAEKGGVPWFEKQLKLLEEAEKLCGTTYEFGRPYLVLKIDEAKIAELRATKIEAIRALLMHSNSLEKSISELMATRIVAEKLFPDGIPNDLMNKKALSFFSERGSFLLAMLQLLNRDEVLKILRDETALKSWKHLAMTSDVRSPANEKTPQTKYKVDPRVADRSQEAVMEFMDQTGLREHIESLVNTFEVAHKSDPYAGAYLHIDRRLTIRVAEDKTSHIPATLLHEFGHAVHFNAPTTLKPTEQLYLDGYAILTALAPKEEGASSYAESYAYLADQRGGVKHILETFAEDFAALFLHPENIEFRRRKLLEAIVKKSLPKLDIEETRKKIASTIGYMFAMAPKDYDEKFDCDTAKKFAEWMDKRKEGVKKQSENAPNENLLEIDENG